MFDIDHLAPESGRFPKRLFLMLFLPVALLIVGGGWYVGRERVEEEMALTNSNEIGSVVMAVRRLDDELHVPLAQFRTLMNEDALKRGAANLAGADLRGVENLFANLIAYNDFYDKVRLLDESGQERVRVNNVAGRPVVLSPGQLQARTDSYYFKESQALKPGEVYISPMDLNVEYGRVEKPYRPMLRLVARIPGDDGLARSVLVLNIAAQGLLDAFTNSLVEARDHAMLLDSRGYWLKSPDSDGEWGFMLGRGDDTLAKRNPEAWQAVSAMPAGQVELADGLWTCSTVYPLKVAESRAATNIPTWLVVAHLSGEQLTLMR
ncbi:MAG: hybrid sensor histidine kinase/response regulator, partial [Thiobacillus sp.]|nr:hybrid sensor histidine kinase/response regulator [Thiobacillus sp.]